MSNYAALIDVLSVAGSRLSDGSANASGTVWFFQPGTNTPVNVYSNASATTIITKPVTLTDGGLLNRSDFPDGIYVTQPVRLYIEDVNGTAVSDTTYIPATAGDVGVSNTATSATTLDQWITQAQTSTGGTDFQYLVAPGQTSRPIGATITEICVSVKSFGAKGDGIAIDTTSIQNAMNFVQAAGGGVVWFPAGTYLVDQALTLTSANSVRLVGAGMATLVKSNNATANLFTFATAATTCSVEKMRISHTGTSTGAMISVAAGTDFFVDTVITSTAFWAYGCDFSGATNWRIANSQIAGSTRSIRSNTSGSARPSSLIATVLPTGATVAIELNGNQGSYYFAGNHITGTTGILFNASYTGTGIRAVGNKFICTTVFDMSGLSTDPDFRQWRNGVDGYSSTIATGSTQIPDRSKGQEITYNVTTGGAGTVTVSPPTPTPTSSMQNTRLTLKLINALGGAAAVTWSLNAIFKLVGAAAPTGTDATTSIVEFLWDTNASKWREVCRSNTAT